MLVSFGPSENIVGLQDVYTLFFGVCEYVVTWLKEIADAIKDTGHMGLQSPVSWWSQYSGIDIHN